MIRPFTVVAMLLAGGTGLYVYQAKHNAQMLEREIGRTVKATEAARERAGMLRTEWALLNDPERLQSLADQFLTIKPLRPDQYTQFSDLEKRLPPVSIRPHAGGGTDEDEAGQDDLPVAARPTTPPLAPAAPSSPALAAAAAASRPTLVNPALANSAPGTATAAPPPAQTTASAKPATIAAPVPPSAPVQQAAARPAVATAPPPTLAPLPSPPQQAAMHAPASQPAARESQSSLAAAKSMPAPVPLTPPQRSAAPVVATSAPRPAAPTQAASAPAYQAPAYQAPAYQAPAYPQSASYQPSYRQPAAYTPPPPATPAEAIARIARGGPVDTSIPAVASALGAARSMSIAPPVPIAPASAANWR